MKQELSGYIQQIYFKGTLKNKKGVELQKELKNYYLIKIFRNNFVKFDGVNVKVKNKYNKGCVRT